MRAHTTVRTAFLMVAAAAGLSFAAGDARADVATDSGAPNTSSGTAALKYDHNKGLDTSFDTGFLGYSKSGITAQVRAVVRIDPVKDGGPLFSINMPKGAIVQASWAGDQKIVLKAVNGAQTDGMVTVRHTLTPDLQVKLGAFGIAATIDYNASTLLQKVQDQLGANATFAYDSQASQAFAPWAFVKADTKLNAPNLDGSELFTIPIADMPELISNNFDGDIGVRAVTNPTFSYTTKKVTLSGAAGNISAQGGEVSLPAADGDFLETMAAVEGEMVAAGEMKIQPFIHLTEVPVLGAGINLDLPFTAYSTQYTTPATKIVFQSVMVHIPLPNVHTPKQGVDLGAVKAGGTASKTITIENSGEKAASMSFKSSDPAFSVPGGTINVEPKGKYELTVKFAPVNAGPASADITVMSNDPDSPQQVFKIGANGADVGAPPGDAPAAGGNGDSGCGCKTAGTSTLPSWAGFGVMGLGALVFARRRKNAR